MAFTQLFGSHLQFTPLLQLVPVEHPGGLAEGLGVEEGGERSLPWGDLEGGVPRCGFAPVRRERCHQAMWVG